MKRKRSPDQTRVEEIGRILCDNPVLHLSANERTSDLRVRVEEGCRPVYMISRGLRHAFVVIPVSEDDPVAALSWRNLGNGKT